MMMMRLLHSLLLIEKNEDDDFLVIGFMMIDGYRDGSNAGWLHHAGVVTR